jgi:transposase
MPGVHGQAVANKVESGRLFYVRFKLTIPGGKPPLLNSQQIEILEQLVQEDNAPTLQELSDHLAEKQM